MQTRAKRKSYSDDENSGNSSANTSPMSSSSAISTTSTSSASTPSSSSSKKLKSTRKLQFTTAAIQHYITRTITDGPELGVLNLKIFSPASSQETEPEEAEEKHAAYLQSLVQESNAIVAGTPYERYALFIPIATKPKITRTNSQILNTFQEILTGFFQNKKIELLSSVNSIAFVAKFLEKLGNTFAEDKEIIDMVNNFDVAYKNKKVNNSVIYKYAVEAYAVAIALGNAEAKDTLTHFRHANIQFYKNLHPRVNFTETNKTNILILGRYIRAQSKSDSKLAFDTLPTTFNYYEQQTFEQMKAKAKPVVLQANLKDIVTTLDDFFFKNFPDGKTLLADHDNDPLLLLQKTLLGIAEKISFTMTKCSGKLLIALLHKFGDFLTDTPYAGEANTFYQAAEKLGYVKPVKPEEVDENALTPPIENEDGEELSSSSSSLRRP